MAGKRLVEILGRCRDERLVGPALVRDVGEPGVEQRKIGSGIDGKVHHAVLAGFHLAGIDGYGAAWIDDDDAARSTASEPNSAFFLFIEVPRKFGIQ